MSEFHASPSGGSANVSLEDADETLTDAQQTTLRQGLVHAPLPLPHADFNTVVLAIMQSGQDFETLPQQAKTRLRWAARPAVIGFALMYGLAFWQAQTLPRPPAPYPRVNHAQPAPPLPNLPLISQLGKLASATSALPKSPSPSDAGASGERWNLNSPSPSDAGAARRGVGVRSQSAASTSLNTVPAMGGLRHDR